MKVMQSPFSKFDAEENVHVLEIHCLPTLARKIKRDSPQLTINSLCHYFHLFCFLFLFS